MTHLLAALAYIRDAAHWTGPLGIGRLAAQHAIYSLAAVALACVVGLPLGWWVAHSGRGRDRVAALLGAARSLPTLGLLTLFGLWLGIGLAAPMLAFVVLALPSVLAGAYTGVETAPEPAA